MQLLLQAGASPNTADEEGFTPLHSAASLGYNDIILELIRDPRTVVDYQSHSLFTPLLEAVVYNHTAAAKTLLAHNANVNVANMDGLTPLHLIAEYGNEELLQFILENKIPVNLTLQVSTCIFCYMYLEPRSVPSGLYIQLYFWSARARAESG